MSKLISTTALAKRNDMRQKELFTLLEEGGFVVRREDGIHLTAAGEQLGGGYIESRDFGRYVGWPEDLDIVNLNTGPSDNGTQKLLTATAVGKHFGLSANKCNYIFSELGWLKKGLKGWLLTNQGERVGGQQSEDHRSGIPYVRWPADILGNKSLVATMEEVTGTAAAPEAKPVEPDSTDGFRDKFPATHRAADGHMVRSRAEMLIDNWLYMAEIVHAYERKLPIEEDVYCDFYIPTGKVYIEFWGLEDDPKYRARKEKKLAIYEKYGFNLVQLGDADVQNLDDVLPRLLLKFGVQAY